MIKIAATKPVRLFFAGALALSMSSAAAITASANQAYAETDDGYTYCYAGLSWAEYWAGEDVLAAGSAEASDKTDSSGQYDRGAFDTVSRATTNHGLHRGSFQCNATIHAQDADGNTKDFAISHWADDGKSFTTTNGETVAYSKGVCTYEGTSYTLQTYDVYGLKYVPVKVKTSDFEAFKADREDEGYAVVENGGTLAGGYTEKFLKSYTATADVDATTHGLKTATLNEDGSFSFSAADESLTGSGIEDQDSLKKVTETTKEEYEASSDEDKAGKIYPIIAEIGGDVEPGGFGEMIRVDLDGDYGDLGSNLQSVTWTYYGNDATGTKAVQTFGTKFAADNWMHKSMHIQLGLTDSIRCQFPEGYDGTGYWKLTVHALGYEDFTTSLFSISESNIDDGTLVSGDTKQKLQSVYDKGAALAEKDYTTKTWSDLQTELGETSDLLAKEDATEAACSQQIKHVTEALNSLVKVIAKPTVSSTKFTYNGKQQSPFKDGTGYTVSGKQTNAGSYTAKVTLAKGYAWNAEGDTSTVSQSYTIAKANQSLTAKASTKTVKKAKVKKKAQKVSGAIKVTGAQGKVTYAKKSGSAKLKVASNGKITVKKKTKKGTYKVKVVVKAAGNGNYNAATKTVTVKVKVK